MITIAEASRLLREGAITSRSLTEKYLAAIKRENVFLNAYTTVTEAEALASADRADAMLSRGENTSPLCGIPFILKDNISTCGIRTTCASKMLESFVPVYDAFVWTALRNAGAVLLGKGNMDEFAMGSTCENSRFGGAKNPFDLDRVAGGSSGGSASAVAGGLAVFGLGSDTGGSIREPASFCGLVGLKPTYGAVSRRGLVAFASSFDQIGPLASCTEDAAAVFDAISGKDSFDMTSVGSERTADKLNTDVRGMRLGIAPEFYEGLPDTVRKPLSDTADVFRSLGAELVPVSMPSLKYCLPVYYILACAEASSNLGRYDGIRYGFCSDNGGDLDEIICRTRTEGFGEEVRRRILLGSYVLSAGYFDAYYKSAERLRSVITADFSAIFDKCDALLTPTVPMTALPRGAGLSPVETYQTDICTVSANIAGIPAVSFPCGFDGNLPVGAQLMGRRFDEKAILSLSLAFERATNGEYLRSSGRGVQSL